VPVQFLGGPRVATPVAYPTCDTKSLM